MTVEQIRKEGTKKVTIETAIHEAAAKIREIIEQTEATVKANDGDETDVESRILDLVNE